jgi:hypothetical protein
MSPAGFELIIPASERPKTHALDRAPMVLVSINIVAVVVEVVVVVVVVVVVAAAAAETVNYPQH